MGKANATNSVAVPATPMEPIFTKVPFPTNNFENVYTNLHSAERAAVPERYKQICRRKYDAALHQRHDGSAWVSTHAMTASEQMNKICLKKQRTDRCRTPQIG